MKHSFTYYLTMLVIKLKGIKNKFETDPIDYKSIRKEDVYIPKGNFFKQNVLNNFRILDSEITEIGSDKAYDKLLIFIHGGAFISGPAQHHWDSIKTITQKTNHKIWMCNYPKAPENDIKTISTNIDATYHKALESYTANNIILVGDSVGGTLSTTLVQRLVVKNKALPNKVILITPVMDASMSNPEIKKIENIDPMLSKKGVLSAKRMCAGDLDLKDPMISPLYGSFKGFPKTILFVAQNDIMYSDAKLAVTKLKEEKINIRVVEGEEMSHIWPFLPVMKEAKIALYKIIEVINN